MWPFALFVWLYSLIFSIVFRFKDFFASVQRVSSKTDNNRTAGEGTCYELGTIQRINSADILQILQLNFALFTENFSLPENTRSCWPVRPIPRRNFMQEASTMNETHPLSSGPNQSGSSNAAIGVVIPTTPNSTLHHQQQNHINEQLLQHNHHHHHQSTAKNHNQNYNHIDADNLMMSRANLYAKYENRKRIPTATATTSVATNALNVEDRLNQIQDYIRITTTLLDSIQGEKVSHHLLNICNTLWPLTTAFDVDKNGWKTRDNRRRENLIY